MQEQVSTSQISRRGFLRALSILTASGVLSACAVEAQEPPAPTEPEVLDVRVPSGQVNRAAPQVDEVELTRFLRLSSLLTGVDTLDPVLGALYLQSLQADAESGASLSALFEQARDGSAPVTLETFTLETLESRGIFDDEALRAVADKITEQWYTGIYTNEQGEDTVATYVDALAWKTLTFTKATTVCGSYRFWTEPPESAID